MTATVRVSPKGAARWDEGHPWIYRTDVIGEHDAPGVVHVEDRRGKFLGQALWSPRSEIRLRLLEPSKRKIDAAWWREKIAACVARRSGIDANAYRVVHGEGDGLPSLVVDRYDRWVVAQLLSAGLETMRADIVAALVDVLKPEGVLLRNDASVRKHEGLAEGIELVHGEVPQTIEVREGAVRFLAAPWEGQKTGAFLDQRENRLIAGALTKPEGTALDCFAYHGSFAMHLAKRAGRVCAVDQSKEALVRGTENAVLNGYTNIDWVEADAFELVRSWERAGRKFDTIVVDPPAFAKSKSAIPGALRGYKEINLRAMRLLAPGGTLITASCSFHVRLPLFLEMLAGAAADSGRRLTLKQVLGQGQDHPEIVTIPETGYLKGAVLVAE
ncbi:MAG TPA: class I SAM-dependent rRNA methyltransferase [Gemmatimonadales bacterium]